MSEEKASPCVLHIHGENIQVLPNAMFAIQYICLDPGEKPEVVSEKDVVEAGKPVTVCYDQIMPLQSGQYLMSFGCTSYHLEELVIHHRLYDACFLEVFSMKDTVGFFDMNSTVTYE